ncbi:MAG TPA: hypothetical protein H9783_02135 [Candidatus Limosilactobacillus faecipullorum]|nr:hypothetical protein [Candidatus Limosilactobacillus faecipullorum]
MILSTVSWIIVILIIWVYHRSLTASAEKELSLFGSFTRVLLALILSLRIAVTIVTFPTFLGLHLFQIILLLFTIVITELSFRRLRLTFGNPRLARTCLITNSIFLLVMPW